MGGQPCISSRRGLPCLQPRHQNAQESLRFDTLNRPSSSAARVEIAGDSSTTRSAAAMGAIHGVPTGYMP